MDILSIGGFMGVLARQSGCDHAPSFWLRAL